MQIGIISASQRCHKPLKRWMNENYRHVSSFTFFRGLPTLSTTYQHFFIHSICTLKHKIICCHHTFRISVYDKRRMLWPRLYINCSIRPCILYNDIKVYDDDDYYEDYYCAWFKKKKYMLLHSLELSVTSLNIQT